MTLRSRQLRRAYHVQNERSHHQRCPDVQMNRIAQQVQRRIVEPTSGQSRKDGVEEHDEPLQSHQEKNCPQRFFMQVDRTQAPATSRFVECPIAGLFPYCEKWRF